MQDSWQKNIAFAETLRRQLHAHPELSWQEKNTAILVRSQLDALNISWRACAETGTVAWLNKKAKGAAIALRGDMDALPIHEQTGKEWQSLNQGCMHACGHDGHTATLLATARWLKQFEHELPQPVVLIFQPAEEGFHGAREMIKDGALEGVKAIYGWHNWPALPYGTIACPDDIVMCGNGTFSMEFKGRGGHASQPELCADPLLAASAVNVALQQIVSRRIAPQATAVISVTQMNGGSAPTVIPESATLNGSIRVPDEATRQLLNQHISAVATQTSAAYGVECVVQHDTRYQATINHKAPATQARDAWQSLYGQQTLNHGQALPIMASEDFSYYLQAIPGAFALIGSNDGEGHDVPCHSPHYDFNDRLIADVCRWFCQLAGLRNQSLTK
ncbi:N(2)-acetyl-L-2,4-diaminobutanoate deacetylase DoeB2 [Marinomonas sp. RSW2]|uniref:N(2)-acetyl-L-2,4-diaminobutanoate deacetylase DoeB2 n=1 Tax=Marinomonas maritima TaxID=2940935 RepID=A0ABT5WFY3_9GAMM|nr:N(2)-acetyl-L-2,4-diaminobutanoate deacetylase DoeB2 [Marinomonas maritima]MDE8602940.1 N(2)-acetyl-L-2,4-diaminobutanoate deacetylase DoeB2 [Marinomonas maritima]